MSNILSISRVILRSLTVSYVVYLFIYLLIYLLTYLFIYLLFHQNNYLGSIFKIVNNLNRQTKEHNKMKKNTKLKKYVAAGDTCQPPNKNDTPVKIILKQ